MDDKINSIVLSTDSLYIKAHEIYRIVNNDKTIPAQNKWSWRKFASVEVKPEEKIYEIHIKYSVYNKVTNKLEIASQLYNFYSSKERDTQYQKFIEQAKAQDPTSRYADDALANALK